jgi:hypothetical protein
MIRKLLVVAAAIAMPVSIVAVTGGVASAKVVVPPNPPVTCTVSATVNFAAPGISTPGSASLAKVSTTTTTSETFGTKAGKSSCTGTAPGNNIPTKGVKCAKKGPQPSSNSACVPGDYGYDSWANFENSGSAAIAKALKHLSFTINGIAYSSKTASAATVVGGACGSEAGFQLNGAISAPKPDKGQTVVLVACLGVSTGTGLTSYTNFAANAFGPGTVTSAQIDASTSTIKIAGG